MTTAPVGCLDEQTIARARKILARLCDNGLVSMSIPVRDTDEDMTLSAVIEFAAAALSASSQEGWQLVPVEPTPKMIGAARCYGRDDRGNIDPAFAYHHMLAAAPHQAQEAQGDRHGE